MTKNEKEELKEEVRKDIRQNKIVYDMLHDL